MDYMNVYFALVALLPVPPTGGTVRNTYASIYLSPGVDGTDGSLDQLC